MAPSNGSRPSGSAVDSKGHSTAIIPQPMSTPTAEGMTAPTVGMTEPMVAPMPTWASGIRATWPAMNGSFAARCAWAIVASSRSDPHVTTLPILVLAILLAPS